MQYTVDKNEKEAKIAIKIDSAEWEESLEHVYQHNKHNYSLPGFRKGKVPRKALEKVYGASVFFEDTFNEVFSKAYGEVLSKEKEIEPIDVPDVKVDEMGEDGTISVTATVPVKPQVKLGEYTGLKIEVSSPEVTDHDIEHELYHLRERASRKVNVNDRAAKSGDIVNINFSGSVDGVKFEGGTAEKYELEIGSHTFIEGFEDQIIGMNLEQTKDINVKFPDDYNAEQLKGKPAVFEVKLNEIFVKEIPEADDKFAKDTSAYETLEEYKKSIKEKLLGAKQRNCDTEKENKLIQKIAEQTKIDLPEVMIEHQTEHMIEDITTRLKYQGMTFDQYLKYLNSDLNKFKADHREDAEKAVITRLAVEEIIKKENLIVTQEEINAKIDEYAQKSKKTDKEYLDSMGDKQYDYLINELTMNKLLTFLKSKNEFIEAAHSEHEEDCPHCK